MTRRLKLSWLLCTAVLFGGCCGDNDEDIQPPPPVTDGGASGSSNRGPDAGESTEAEESFASTPSGRSRSPAGAGDAGSLEGTINITIRDFQLFHPDSSNRALLDLRDFSRLARLRGGGDFAIGLILEARNESPYLLESPRVISDVSIVGEHGAAMCKIPPQSGYSRGHSPVTVLSQQRDERTPWAEEARDALEAPWRPQETIRIGVVLRCGPVHVHDLGVTGIEGFFNVAARAPFAPHVTPCSRPREICDDDVVGTSSPIELPARIVSVRSIEVSGQPAFVAADLVVRVEEGRVVREVLRDHGHTLLASQGEDLPMEPTAIQETSDEWSMSVESVQLRHWVDVPTAPKGSRIVTVAAEIRVDAGAIEGRLRAAVDTAREADQQAQAALVEAQGSTSGESTDQLRQAESSARTAAAELARAQSTFERSRGTERSRLARLLACDRVELVTHRRNLRAVNAREQATTCRELTFRNTVRVEWSYALGRYEIPLGLSYSLGRDSRTSFFASQRLSTFDAR